MDSKAANVRLQILNRSAARRALLRAFLIATALSVIPLVHILFGPYLKMLAPVASGGCAMHLGQSASNFTPSWYVFQGRHLNSFWSSIEPTQCRKYGILTDAVVGELVSKQLLSPEGARALCIGEGSVVAAKTLRDLGFSYSVDLHKQKLFSLKRKQFLAVINHKEGSFDFVLTRDLDMVPVPVINHNDWFPSNYPIDRE